MALPEYKSPKVANPRYGYQRYQYANKSAAELKTSLWAANLSEVVLTNNSGPYRDLDFPMGKNLDIRLENLGKNGAFRYLNEKTFTLKSERNEIAPLKNAIEVTKYLNDTYPFLGKWGYIQYVQKGLPAYNFTLTLDKSFCKDSDNTAWLLNIALG
jgi:hypothetical protein